MARMKTSIKLVQDALKVPLVTDEAVRLYKIVEQFYELTKFLESTKEVSDVRVKKLQEQIERQKAMIENLEKTLWGKK
jgi:hypothetical protein